MKPPIGSAVIVYNFGAHPGVVIGHDPEIAIQGRARVAVGWIKVKLDAPAGREWNGDPELVSVVEANDDAPIDPLDDPNYVGARVHY